MKFFTVPLRMLFAIILFLEATTAFSQSDSGLIKELASESTTIAKGKTLEVIKTQDFDEIRKLTKTANDKSRLDWNGVSNKDDWEKYSRTKISLLKKSLGSFPKNDTPLNQKVLSSIKGDGFSIECIVYESRPEFWVTANLYRPAKESNSMPGIIICHAHHTSKEHSELQEMGIIWARAGGLVLVLDQLGHGERRQHSFINSNSYSKPFRTSRQDYYFRYDLGVQLHLLEESLMGWMVWDLQKGVDLLLQQTGIAKDKIVLLGSVAGGGDPAAVAGALDSRISVVAPFNFGGPQPETKMPLPADAETSFNYAGGGSWESTRNLYHSAKEGFLPWVIVGSIAPRHLIYGHEFSWDRENDPVWKRFEKIYQLYDSKNNLGFAIGKGDLKGSPPEASHCTHIGRVHRKNIHELLESWVKIKGVKDEPQETFDSIKLRCLTSDALKQNHPVKITKSLESIAQQQIDAALKKYAVPFTTEQREEYKKEWSGKLGQTEIKGDLRTLNNEITTHEKYTLSKVILNDEKDRVLPLLLIQPINKKTGRVVVMVSQGGKGSLLASRAEEIANLISIGYSVCLPDVRGTGELKTGQSRGRSSNSTGISASLMMHGETKLAGQLHDLRSILSWLRKELPQNDFMLWGDSPVTAINSNSNFNIPRDDETALPIQPEPTGALLMALGALYEGDVKAIYLRGGIVSYKSVLKNYLVQIPHDTIVPGIFNLGDFALLLSALEPKTIFLDKMVDGFNQEVSGEELKKILQEGVKGIALPKTLNTNPSGLNQFLSKDRKD